MKRQTLGKNLQTLLSTAHFSAKVSADETLKKIPIEEIKRNPYQPRRVFDPEKLQELANSIKAQGVLQPIIVRQFGQHYELIAGERRWRASQLAGLTAVPAIVRQVSDEAALALALIENIQRADLNSLEECYALQRLQEEFNMTHEAIAEAVGRSRTAVTNLLRLQNLAAEVRTLLEQGKIEMGHARALLSLSIGQQYPAARQIIEQQLSVRQTEQLVKKLLQNKMGAAKPNQSSQADITALENNISEVLCAKVAIKHQTSGKGTILIHYNSLAELDGILGHIK